MKTLAWATVSSYVERRVPFRQPLGGSKGAQLVFDGADDSMEVLLPCGASDPVPKVVLAHIHLRKQVLLSQTYLVVEGRGLRSLQPMHQLGVLCATFLEATGATAAGALVAGLNAWSQLLEGRPLLSPESQVGLRGELELLKALVISRGPTAVNSWTAYNKQIAGRHDFRLDTFEIEVKSTRNRARQHWISGLQQLVASPGRALFILSLQFEQSGLAFGQTLPESIQVLRALLAGSPDELGYFENCLALAMYRNEDAGHYDERLQFASGPMLIPVDAKVPCLTADNLRHVLSPDALQRLLDAKYQVDVGELGFGSDDARFSAVLGPWNTPGTTSGSSA